MLRVTFSFVQCALFLAACGFLQAQIETPVPRAPHQALASTAEMRVLNDIAYVAGGHDRQKLDLYLPPEGGPPRPLVVWIHGGGWISGDRKPFPNIKLLKNGYALASVEYRFSRDAAFPAQIEDCKSAIRWLRAHAAEYGIDAKRIGVWGRSAGGHLVALLGLTGNNKDFDKGENLNQPSDVQCVVDWFGPTDLVQFGDPTWTGTFNAARKYVHPLIGGPPEANAAKARAASPITYVHKGAAPFLIMHGSADPLVPEQQSEKLDAALRNVGVESTLVVIPNAKHGGPAFGTPERFEQIAAFFDKHLKAPPAGR